MDKMTLDAEKVRVAKVVAVNVWTLRKRAGLTQAKLAERMGSFVPVISKLEAARGFPSLTTVVKAAYALGVTPCHLLEEPKE